MQEEQPGTLNRSRTVSVQELQARLMVLLFPANGNLAQTVALTAHGKVVMVLVPWYHFQGQVRMEALRVDLPIITKPISCTEARKRATTLHKQLLQLAQVNGETLVALVILRHREPVGGLMCWDHYELLYPHAAAVLLSARATSVSSTSISTLTIVQARNRLLRLPEDFAAGGVQIPLVVTKRVYQGRATEDRPVLLILPFPSLERK